MPMWRCPHCGTPQAETARCWVCHRSSTACLTCRHYRSSVAAKLGYCGLDQRRLPLTGDEIRSCWEAGPLPYAPTIAAAGDAIAETAPPPAAPRLAFIEVVSTSPERPGPAATVPSLDAPAASLEPPGGRWSLWED